MTKRGRSRTRVRGDGRRSAALLALLAVAALAVAGCPDENECERCSLIFRWDSDGNFIELNRTCAALDCGVARCGSCYDLEYTSEGLPQRGTCDTCSAETDQCAERHPTPAPGEEWMYCASAPGDHCVDVYSDPDHCGECDIPCAAGQNCVEGECR
jgi:hypothetical protein